MNRMRVMRKVTLWLGRNRGNYMASCEKNILSDPTSDGNISGYDATAPTALSDPPSYHTCAEFDRRPINVSDVNVDRDSPTQRCPTCGGTGKLTKEQEHDLVALIPVRDRRLKPRRTILYLILAILLCLAISAVIGVIFFPRSITVKLESAFPVNITIPKSQNISDPFIIINSTISIHNHNFFDARLDHFNIEVNWQDYVVANPEVPGSVKVARRSSLNHTFYVTTSFPKKEGDKIRRVCCGWSFNLAFFLTVSAKTHSILISSQVSDSKLKYINCKLDGVEWWKNCIP